MTSDRTPTPLGNILVVDDEPLIAMLIEDAFHDEGYSCRLAGTGTEAIMTLEADGASFHALITDIRMPNEITGWAVARRARDIFPKIAVIYLTGDSMVDMEANSVPEGKLLGKPIPVGDIVSAVASLLVFNPSA